MQEEGLDEAVRTLTAARAGESVPQGDTARALAVVDGLLAEHQDAVYAMCQRIIGDPERSREVAQDALLVAWRKIDRFRGDSAFRTWLLGIARFKAMRAVEKKRDLLTSDGVVEADDATRSVLSQLRRHEREELLRQASLAVLDETEQEAVYLRYVEQLSQDRITEILQLKASSGARGLLQRCRRKLRRALRERLAELGHGSSFIRTAWS